MQFLSDRPPVGSHQPSIHPSKITSIIYFLGVFLGSVDVVHECDNEKQKNSTRKRNGNKTHTHMFTHGNGFLVGRLDQQDHLDFHQIYHRSSHVVYQISCSLSHYIDSVVWL